MCRALFKFVLDGDRHNYDSAVYNSSLKVSFCLLLRCLLINTKSIDFAMEDLISHAVTHMLIAKQICSLYFGTASNAGIYTSSIKSGGGVGGGSMRSKTDLPLLLLPGRTGRSPPSLHRNQKKQTTVRHSTTSAASGALGRVLLTQLELNTTSITHNDNTRVGLSFQHEQNRRILRLRSVDQDQQKSKSFSFIPELVAERGRKRVQEFSNAYSSVSPAMRSRLDKLNKQLNAFGYTLLQWQPKSTIPSVFVEWELIPI